MSTSFTAVATLVLALTLGAHVNGASISTTSTPVRNIRLESARPVEHAPAAVLKFDLVNSGLTTVGLVKLRISIVEKPDPEDDAVTNRRVLLRPFTVLGHIAFESGNTVTYEMLLRHFSADCSCVPVIEVISADPQIDPDSEMFQAQQ